MQDAVPVNATVPALAGDLNIGETRLAQYPLREPLKASRWQRQQDFAERFPIVVGGCSSAFRDRFCKRLFLYLLLALFLEDLSKKGTDLFFLEQPGLRLESWARAVSIRGRQRSSRDGFQSLPLHSQLNQRHPIAVVIDSLFDVERLETKLRVKK